MKKTATADDKMAVTVEALRLERFYLTGIAEMLSLLGSRLAKEQDEITRARKASARQAELERDRAESSEPKRGDAYWDDIEPPFNAKSDPPVNLAALDADVERQHQAAKNSALLAGGLRQHMNRPRLHAMIGTSQKPIFEDRSLGRGRTTALSFSLEQTLTMAVLWRLSQETHLTLDLGWRRVVAAILHPAEISRALLGREGLMLYIDQNGPRLVGKKKVMDMGPEVLRGYWFPLTGFLREALQTIIVYAKVKMKD